MRYISLFITIAIVFAGLILIKQNQTADSLEEEELVALGDSLTYGVGEAGHGYVDDLQHSFSKNHPGRLVVHNYGIPGQQSDGLLLQLQKKQVQKSIADADYIIIFIGTNDLLKHNGNDLHPIYEKKIQNGKADYTKNVKKILTFIRKENPDAPVLYLGLYNPLPDNQKIGGIVKKWNDTSKNVISEYPRTKFIATDEIFKEKSGEFFSDALHPNKRGYQLITKKIIEEYDF
ncbi:GDSL-type esterase/lipase family protein [Thalassobacillus pellis]|uniref:DUF459 domain-containing protein n=1 Tax=Thalassobacillus pellis TaxID=748008 RepID=UPI001961C53E|nr:GDSL-type esterase/lipase family protein [Thalassobacillus pellis]MBM7553599.1 lysophospholipase L1-like esterase [Thalassobacillus pellis]